METTTNNTMERQLANGNWVDCSERSAQFISEAVSTFSRNEDSVLADLNAGKKVRYGTDWYENIRRVSTVATPTVTVELVRCKCGHSVPRSQVMSASLGTSCPACYDRMSGE